MSEEEQAKKFNKFEKVDLGEPSSSEPREDGQASISIVIEDEKQSSTTVISNKINLYDYEHEQARLSIERKKSTYSSAQRKTSSNLSPSKIVELPRRTRALRSSCCSDEWVPKTFKERRAYDCDLYFQQNPHLGWKRNPNFVGYGDISKPPTNSEVVEVSPLIEAEEIPTPPPTESTPLLQEYAHEETTFLRKFLSFVCSIFIRLAQFVNRCNEMFKSS